MEIGVIIAILVFVLFEIFYHSKYKEVADKNKETTKKSLLELKGKGLISEEEYQRTMKENRFDE